MVENAEFTMSGGEITNNKVKTHGGGVYVLKGTFHLSGNVKITDNAADSGRASNVYMVDSSIGSSKIYLDGEIADGSQIAIVSGGPCITNYKQSDKPSKFFTLDFYDCIYVSNKTDGTVTIGSHKGGTATCVAKAVCTECGESYGEVNASKHTPNADDGDCTTAVTCKDCSAVITAGNASHLWSISYQYDDTYHWLKCDRVGCTQTATKIAHSFGVWQTVTEATCSTKGLQRRSCIGCDRYETRDIETDETAHSFGAWQNRVAATCTTAGTKAHSDCSRCNKHFDAAYVEITDLTIAALGHNFSEWTVVKAPTVDEFGEEKRVCSHDGTHTETRQLRKRVAQLVKPDENGGENRVEVTLPDGFTPDTELVVTEIDRENYGAYEAIAQTVSGEIGLVYDVTLKSNGVSVQPGGTLTVRLRIPENMKGKAFKLFHFHEGTATDTEYTVDGSYAVVTTDELSEFIFVGEKRAPAAFDPLWLILIIVVSVIIVGEVGYIVYVKTRKNKAKETDR